MQDSLRTAEESKGEVSVGTLVAEPPPSAPAGDASWPSRLNPMSGARRTYSSRSSALALRSCELGDTLWEDWACSDAVIASRASSVVLKLGWRAIRENLYRWSTCSPQWSEGRSSFVLLCRTTLHTPLAKMSCESHCCGSLPATRLSNLPAAYSLEMIQ